MLFSLFYLCLILAENNPIIDIFFDTEYMTIQKVINMIKNFVVAGLLGITVLSCSENKKSADKKANDEFRTVISKYKIKGDTLKYVTSFLKKMDDKNTEAGAFMNKDLYQISDSCYAANKKFCDSISIYQNERYGDVFDSIVTPNVKKYEAHFQIDPNEYFVAREFFLSHPEIVRYLNKKYNMKMWDGVSEN